MTESTVVENASLPEAIDSIPRPPKTRAKKTLDAVDTEDAKGKVSDVVVVGNPDVWKLICKASSKSEGWMKSTKAMQVVGGCVLQVTTQNGDEVSEALVYVPGVRVTDDANGCCCLA